jgi:hypothetical protein
MNVFSKKPQRITLTRATFSELIRILLYSPEFSKWLPVMMQQAAGGDFSVFAGVSYQIGRSMDDSIARGMHYSVACAEFVAFITDADIAREMEGTFYGTTRMNAYRQACEAWPRAKVDKSFATPVKSDAPVLMISGDLDPVTPPWIAAAALRSLPNGRQVVGQNLAHSISGGCADQITEEFVRKGSARELDTSCIDKIRRPAFITTEMLQAAAKSATTQPAAPSSEEEVWKGVLDTGGAKLRLVLRLSRSADGKVKALLDSLDQDAYGMAVDTVTRTESSLRFEMNLIGGSYEGKVSADGTEIVGEWHQGGATLPLTLRREPVSKKQ